MLGRRCVACPRTSLNPADRRPPSAAGYLLQEQVWLKLLKMCGPTRSMDLSRQMMPGLKDRHRGVLLLTIVALIIQMTSFALARPQAGASNPVLDSRTSTRRKHGGSASGHRGAKKGAQPLHSDAPKPRALKQRKGRARSEDPK